MARNGWLIWYDDGSSFSNEDGPPHAAPRTGVQIVAVEHTSVGRLLWHSSDFYCWQDEWVPRSLLGLMDYLREPGAEKIVLQGRGIAYDRFCALYRLADADTRLAAKSARDVREPEPPAGA